MTKRVFNFNAGPGALPLEVLEQAQAELLDFKGTGMSVMEMSHRSKEFEAVIQGAEADLRTLLGIPSNYKVLFQQGGASLQFTMLPMNLLPAGASADYIVTGVWGKTALKEAGKIGKVRAAAKVLDIEHLLERRPRELSGGQQQRVALGRALVRDPKVFLMDEPLSNLDAKLRVQMRAEIKRFHQDLEATVIYVTHDQLEAVTMADKMAVMSGGLLQQYDAPQRVFENPVNTFVAGFVGSPAMNLVPARAIGAGADIALEGAGGWRFVLSPSNARRVAAARAPELIVGARHSTIRVANAPSADAVPGHIYTVEPTGDVTYAHVRLGVETIIVSVAPDVALAANQLVWLSFDQDRLHLFDAASGDALPAAA